MKTIYTSILILLCVIWGGGIISCQETSDEEDTTNTAPTLKKVTGDLSVDEGNYSRENPSSKIVTLKASDEDDDPLKFKIKEKENPFSISSKGVITANDVIDYESTQKAYTLTVEVSDGTATAKTSITISVSNMNDTAPTWETSGSLSIRENLASGSVITNLPAAIDLDEEDSITYSLRDDHDGRFVLSNLVLSRGTNAFDFETTTNYELVLVASDGVNAAATFTLSVTITDVGGGNAPTWDMPSSTIAVCEDASAGEDIIIIEAAMDADAGDTITYRLKDTLGGLFDLDSDTRLLTKGSTPFNYGTATNHMVVIEASDGDNENVSEYTLTVHVIPLGPTYWASHGRGSSQTPTVDTAICVYSNVLLFKGGSNIEFYTDGTSAGKVKRGYVTNAGGSNYFDWTNGDFGVFRFYALHGFNRYDFYETGVIKRGSIVTGIAVTSYEHSNGLFFLRGDIEFYDNGRVKKGQTSILVQGGNQTNSIWTNNGIFHEWGNQHDIHFYSNGNVRIMSVGNAVWTNGTNGVFAVYKTIHFYENGIVSNAEIDRYTRARTPHESRWTNGANTNFIFKPYRAISFYPTNGKVKSGTLRDNAAWTNAAGVAFTFKADEEVHLYTNGVMRGGTLGDNYTWTNGTNQFVFASGTVLNFDTMGEFAVPTDRTFAVGDGSRWSNGTRATVVFAEGDVTFYADGKVESGRIGANYRWTNAADEVFTLGSGGAVSFYSSGVVRGGTLGQSYTWTNGTNEFVFAAGTVFNFNTMGAMVVPADRTFRVGDGSSWSNGTNGTFLFTNGDVTFYASGKVEEGILSASAVWTNVHAVGTVTSTNAFTFKSNEDIEFYSNGRVKAGELWSDSTWTNGTNGRFTFQSNMDIDFYSDGKVESGTLGTNYRWTNGTNQFVFAPGTVLSFDTNGAIVVPADRTFAVGNGSSWSNGTNGTFLFMGDVTFYADGKVESGTLSGNATWNNGAFDSTFKAGEMISFYTNGNVQEGTLFARARWTNSPLRLTASYMIFESNQMLSFYADGSPKAGYHQNGTSWTHPVYNILLGVGPGPAAFHDDESIKRIRFTRLTTVVFMLGTPSVAYTPTSITAMGFDPDGNVIQMHGTGGTITTATYLRFYSDGTYATNGTNYDDDWTGERP